MARKLGGAAIVGGVFLVLAFAKVTFPALLEGLPGCESDKARTALTTIVRRNFTELKLPVSKIEITAAETVTAGETSSCRASVQVDRHRPVAITYDIRWSRWLMGEYKVVMRPARD